MIFLIFGLIVFGFAMLSIVALAALSNNSFRVFPVASKATSAIAISSMNLNGIKKFFFAKFINVYLEIKV
ncbi:Uncharacterised protein [uncultured archaeon]|nr:Uncharacterised protein [uncultured archaeon]